MDKQLKKWPVVKVTAKYAPTNYISKGTVKINVYPHMSPEEFRNWRYYMADTKGWTPLDCAQHLGCGANQIFDWSNGKTQPAPYVALACAALAWGIEPWTLNYKFKQKKE